MLFCHLDDYAKKNGSWMNTTLHIPLSNLTNLVKFCSSMFGYQVNGIHVILDLGYEPF